MIPTPAVPKRPMGAASRVGSIPMRQVNPGQTKALTSNHRDQVGFEILPSPMRSGCCVRDSPDPLPDGSTLPLLIIGVRYGPLCARKIALNCQPPITALAAG